MGKQKCERCQRFSRELLSVGDSPFMCARCYNHLDDQALLLERRTGRSWRVAQVLKAEATGSADQALAEQLTAPTRRRLRSNSSTSGHSIRMSDFATGFTSPSTTRTVVPGARTTTPAAPVQLTATEAPRPRARLTTCHFCRERIASLNDWIILDHPDHNLPTAFLAHLRCGLIHERAQSGNADADLLGYGILLRRIVRSGAERDPDARWGDTLAGWLSHLRRKTWFLAEMEIAVKDGHALAAKIAMPAKARRASIPLRLRHELLETARGRCSLCGVHSSEVPMHIDHIVPVRDGGTNARENLRVLCAKCNIGKGARPVLHLMASA